MKRSRRDDIFKALNKNETKSEVSFLLDCPKGNCKKCGDLCPDRAQRWLKQNMSAMKNALVRNDGASIWKVTLTPDRWAQGCGHLAKARLTAIEKHCRRSLDSLRQPSTIAIGSIDAWYGNKNWALGATFLVSGPGKSDLRAAFPTAPIDVDCVFQTKSTLLNLFRSCATPKRDQLSGDATALKRRLRREYYSWLLGMKPNSRVFRYGCDRYFNPLEKSEKAIKPSRKLRRRRYPHQLVPHMFGNHRPDCLCIACGGPGRRK